MRRKPIRILFFLTGLRLLTLQPYIFVLKDPLLLHKYHMTQYDGFFIETYKNTKSVFQKHFRVEIISASVTRYTKQKLLTDLQDTR